MVVKETMFDARGNEYEYSVPEPYHERNETELEVARRAREHRKETIKQQEERIETLQEDLHKRVNQYEQTSHSSPQRKTNDTGSSSQRNARDDKTETVHVVLNNVHGGQMGPETTCEVFTDESNADVRLNDSIPVGDPVSDGKIRFDVDIADGTVATRAGEQQSTCEHCGREFTQTNYHKQYCSSRCEMGMSSVGETVDETDEQDEDKPEPVEGIDDDLSRELFYEHASQNGELMGTIRGIERPDKRDYVRVTVECPNGETITEKQSLTYKLPRLCEYHNYTMGAVDELIGEPIPVDYDGEWSTDTTRIKEAVNDDDDTDDGESQSWTRRFISGIYNLVRVFWYWPFIIAETTDVPSAKNGPAALCTVGWWVVLFFCGVLGIDLMVPSV